MLLHGAGDLGALRLGRGERVQRATIQLILIIAAGAAERVIAGDDNNAVRVLTRLFNDEDDVIRMVQRIVQLVAQRLLIEFDYASSACSRGCGCLMRNQEPHEAMIGVWP